MNKVDSKPKPKTKKKTAKKKIKKPNLRKLVKKAFSLWSECGRIMHKNQCELCGVHDKEIGKNGKPTVLNAHHIIIRQNKALRFDLRNLCLLCRNCHKYSSHGAHRGTIIFSEWFRNYRPDDYKYLLENENGPIVDDVESVQKVIDDLMKFKEENKDEL